MILNLIDSMLMLSIMHLGFFQAQLESIKTQNFWKEVSIWSLAFLLSVVFSFKIYDRFFGDAAGILDVLKHFAFLALAIKYFLLTKSLRNVT